MTKITFNLIHSFSCLVEYFPDLIIVFKKEQSLREKNSTTTQKRGRTVKKLK